MAVTAIADVFSPQVIGDVATNILFQKVPLLRSGLVVNAGNRAWSRGGNTVTFPYWSTSTGITQTNPGATRSGVTPSKVSQGTYTEDLDSKIISLDFDKNAFDDIDPESDVNSHVATVVARESGVTIQSGLVLSAEETDLEVSILGASTKTLNVDAIAETKYQRGEYAEDGFPVLFAHSDQILDLLKTDDFKTLSSAAVQAIVQKSGVMPPNGAVGIVHNCWIVPMDSVRNQKTPATVSGITQTGGTATLTTAAAHGLLPGDYISVTGATQTEYNLVAKVLTVPTTTTLTYAVDSGAVSPATGSPVLNAIYNGIMVWPDSLGLYVKKEVTPTVKDVHAGTTVMTVDFDFRFVTTLFRNKPRGAVRLFTN